MIREIRKKMVILGNRSPFAQETKDYINHLERTDWIYMNLLLDGSPLTRGNVESILGGEMVLNGRIMDHVLIERLDRLRDEMYRHEQRSESMDRRISALFAWTFAGEDASAAEYRKSTPTLQVYSYTPLLPGDITAQMEKLFVFAETEEEFENPFIKAALIHNRFLEIYPYREGNEVMARACMEYYLIRKGFPMVPLTLTEPEYNSAFVSYLKNGRSAELGTHIMKAVHDRLELMIQLTAY